jgi:chaperonin GroEL (HSP60 family)
LNDLQAGKSHDVYDVLQKKVVDARSAGVLDPTKVLRVALETASSGAKLALSTGVVVLNRRPDMSYEP